MDRQYHHPQGHAHQRSLSPSSLSVSSLLSSCIPHRKSSSSSLLCSVYILLALLSNGPTPGRCKPVSTSGQGEAGSGRGSEKSLPINVRNNGGEVFREVIRSNVKQNWIGIEFRETDGSLVKQIIDFRNKLQLFSLTRLGEQDLGERRVQTFCFLTSLPEHDYISAESMSQLTQRNPGAIRQAETDSGSLRLAMDVEIVSGDSIDGAATGNGTTLELFSSHIAANCAGDARIYGSHADLTAWARLNVKAEKLNNVTASLRRLDSWNRKSEIVGNEKPSSSSILANGSVPNSSLPTAAIDLSNSHPFPVEKTQLSSVTSRRCGDLLQSIYRNLTNGQTSPAEIDSASNAFYERSLCQCSISLVIPFYPCAIKYCPPADETGSAGKRYRCGIKTCRRKYDFLFAVQDKLKCLSSFDPTVENAPEVPDSEAHFDDLDNDHRPVDGNSDQKSDLLQN